MEPATIENLNHEWSPQEPSKTRRLKVVLPQYFAALAIFAVNLSLVTLQYACYKVIRPEEIQLMLYLGQFIAILIGGIIAQIIGVRVMVFLAGAVSIVGWIILEWIYSDARVKWTICIVILAGGMVQAPSFVYLAEISQPNMRNTLVSTIFVTSSIANIYVYMTVQRIRTIAAFINIIFTLIGLVVMYFFPESPYWLANKGRYHAAESSLAWFRGRTTVENVKSESKTIISNSQSNPSVCKLFVQAPLYISSLTIGYVFGAIMFVRIFSVQFLSYMPRMIRDLGSDEVSVYTYISQFIGVSTFLLSIGFVVLVTIFRKRTVFLVSLFGGTVAIFVASIAGFLYQSDIFGSDIYSWIFLICTKVTYFCLTISVEPVTLLLNAELFPSRLRYFGAGLGLLLSKISMMYKNLEVITNLHLALLILASCSMIALISLLRIFPRNENKSLVEIEYSLKELFTSMKTRVNFYIK